MADKAEEAYKSERLKRLKKLRRLGSAVRPKKTKSIAEETVKDEAKPAWLTRLKRLRGLQG